MRGGGPSVRPRLDVLGTVEEVEALPALATTRHSLIAVEWTRKKASTAGCRMRAAWWSGVFSSSDRHSLRVIHRSSSWSCLVSDGIVYELISFSSTSVIKKKKILL